MWASPIGFSKKFQSSFLAWEDIECGSDVAQARVEATDEPNENDAQCADNQACFLGPV